MSKTIESNQRQDDPGNSIYGHVIQTGEPDWSNVDVSRHLICHSFWDHGIMVVMSRTCNTEPSSTNLKSESLQVGLKSDGIPNLTKSVMISPKSENCTSAGFFRVQHFVSLRRLELTQMKYDGFVITEREAEALSGLRQLTYLVSADYIYL